MVGAEPSAAHGLDERAVLTLTLHHEASGEGVMGMAAVANVILNRRRWGRWGATVREVCLAWKQFSCWRPAGGTVNYERLVRHADAIRAGQWPDAVALALEVADAALVAALHDITGGATHYYAPAAMRPAGRMPDWAVGLTPTAHLGRHVYFDLRPREARTT